MLADGVTSGEVQEQGRNKAKKSTGREKTQKTRKKVVSLSQGL
jgi:hypothetical protein